MVSLTLQFLSSSFPGQSATPLQCLSKSIHSVLPRIDFDICESHINLPQHVEFFEQFNSSKLLPSPQSSGWPSHLFSAGIQTPDLTQANWSLPQDGQLFSSSPSEQSLTPSQRCDKSIHFCGWAQHANWFSVQLSWIEQWRIWSYSGQYLTAFLWSHVPTSSLKANSDVKHCNLKVCPIEHWK